MQEDLDRYLAHKRRRARALGLLALVIVMALLLVAFKIFTDSLQGPYDSKAYRPVDVLPETLSK